jgi:hypothetical protein
VPLGESADLWIVVGLNKDLNEAMKQAVREPIPSCLASSGCPRRWPYAYLSAATDYVVSQVVDRTRGVHARIQNSHFVERRGAAPPPAAQRSSGMTSASRFNPAGLRSGVRRTSETASKSVG